MKKFILYILAVLMLLFLIYNALINKIIEDRFDQYLEIENGAVILNYHEINNIFGSYEDEGMNSYNVSARCFKKQMKYLINNNINILTMEELEQKMDEGVIKGKNVVLTFDDIDDSVYKNAYPILKEYNIPFTLFIVTSKPGQTYDERDYATWEMIEEMEASGLATIGLHTHNLHYKQADGNPPFLVDTAKQLFEDDLRQSIAEYKKHFDNDPKYFAYPYGFGNSQTDQILIDNGISMIFSLNGDITTVSDDKFYMPRFLINKSNQRIVKLWLENEE